MKIYLYTTRLFNSLKVYDYIPQFILVWSSPILISQAWESLCDLLLSDEYYSLSHRGKFVSLSVIYRYFPYGCSDILRFSVPAVHTFEARTRHATYKLSSFLSYSICNEEVPLREIIPRESCFVDQTPGNIFLRHYDLSIFKSILHIL